MENYVTIREYLGFNYMDFIFSILNFIDSPQFESREFKSPKFEGDEWSLMVVKYKLNESLTPDQINNLRLVLKEGFIQGKRLVDIKQDILNKVQPGDLVMKNGAILSESVRSTIIARTEVVRATNQGLLSQLKEDDIESVQWISSIGDRTCPYCDDMNGEILSLDDADDMIPAHDQCRCTWAPVE